MTSGGFRIVFDTLVKIANIKSKKLHAILSKGKGKGLDTCYSATYMSQTRDQQRFTISEVAADWYEPVVLLKLYKSKF